MGLLTAAIFLILFVSASGVFLLFSKPNLREFIYLSPVVGGAFLGIFSFFVLTLTNGSMQLSGGFVVVICILGLCGWFLQPGLKEDKEAIFRLCLVSVASVGILGFPFLLHVLPPDADPMYTTSTAAYLLIEEKYPFLDLYVNTDGAWVPSKILLPDSFALTIALAAQLKPSMVGAFSIGLALAWSAAALIALVPIALHFLGNRVRALTLVIIVIALGLSSPFSWNYGGGSYTRTPGIAIFVAIGVLFWRFKYFPAALFNSSLAVLIASTVYFHQRYTVLIAVYVVVMSVYVLIKSVKQKNFKIYFGSLSIAAIMTFILAAPSLYLLADFISLNENPVAANEATVTATWVWKELILARHGVISSALCVFSIAFFWRKVIQDTLYFAAFAQVVIFAFFVTPELMRAISPHFASFIVARSVAVEPMLLARIVFILPILLVISHFFTKEKFHSRKPFYRNQIGVLIALVASVNIIEFVILLSNSVLAQLQILKFSLTPFWGYWAGLIGVGLAARVFCNARKGNPKVNGKNLSLTIVSILSLLLFSIEISKGRFYLSFWSPQLIEVSEWIADNTDQNAVIFKGCNLGIHGQDWREARTEEGKLSRSLNWDLDWLPVTSSRRTVCNMLQRAASVHNAFSFDQDYTSDWYNAHQQLYGTLPDHSVNYFSKVGATHVVISHNTMAYRNQKTIDSPYLDLVFATSDARYKVYKVLEPSGL